MTLRFGSPENAVLLAVLPVLALVWWKSPVYVSPRARVRVFALRVLSVLFLVLALVDPRLPRTEKGTGRGLAVVLDVSDSIGPETARRTAAALWEHLPAWRQAAGPGARFHLGMLGSSVLAVPENAIAQARPGTSADPLNAEIDRRRQGPGKRSTNLADALSFARDAFPPSVAARLVLVTDGRTTRGDLEPELMATKLRGIRIHPVALSPDKVDPLYVESLQAPAQVFVGDEFTVGARIASANAGSVNLTLRRDGTVVEKKLVTVKPGITTWTTRLPADSAGAIPLELSVDAIDVADLHPENNVHSAFVRCRQIPKILVASADPRTPLALVEALSRANLQVERKGFRELGNNEGLLDPYAALVIDAPGPQDLDAGQQEAIRRYVMRKGGGLLVSGAKSSLAKGTWLRETLEEALPVHLVPRAEASPFALYLLLDSSGSMAGAPIAQVKFAAKRLISLMSGRFLGVIHFDTSPHTAVRLQQVGANRLEVQTDIDAIQANGGTAFGSSMQKAYDELMALGTSQNHVLLLSDGQPSDAFLVKSMYAKFNQAGIKVSTVGIGQQVNQGLLQEIAVRCGGKYYDVQDLSQVVTIFEDEVERLIGPPFEESTFKPKAVPNHFLVKDTRPGDLPPLHGYLGTTLKKGADAALVNDFGDPILATWQYGLGKAAVWTADMHGPWSRDWRAWTSGFAPFFEAVIKALVRSEVSDFKLSIHVLGREARVVVDAIDKEGRFLNGERLTVVVRPPEGSAERFALRQVEEGRYEGSFPVEVRGFYEATLLRSDGGLDERLNDGGVAVGSDPEYHPGPVDAVTLERLAATTGGRVLSDLSEVASLLELEEANAREEVTPLWPGLAALALLLFFAEVAYRRLGKVHVTHLEDLEGGGGDATYRRIAENYLRMAEDHDQKGEKGAAQQCYLKARSYFLKAENEDQASKMWEKYRRLDRNA